MLFKKFQTENQKKYGLIKKVNFTTISSKDFWKIIKLKLLKDLWDLSKTRFTSIWQLFQRMFILMYVFDDFVNKYNDTVHRTIKMTSIDDISDSYAEYNKDSNKKDPKFKVGDHVITSKYKGIFAKRFCY